jgi:general secretion pathway protein H
MDVLKSLLSVRVFRAVQRRSPEGFSLLELILVVLVMSVAVGISIPVLSRGSASFHLRATGRDIVNTVRYAREKAITEQRELKVVADRENQKLMLTDAYGDGQRTLALPKDMRMERFVLAGQEVAEGPLTIRFLPNGSAEKAEILLKSEAGAFLRVLTDPITGGARVYLGRGEGGQ